jgi:hypothetical protein
MSTHLKNILHSKHALAPENLIDVDTNTDEPVPPTHTVMGAGQEDMQVIHADMIAEARARVAQADKPNLLVFLENVDKDLTGLDQAVYTNDTGLNELKKKVSGWLGGWYLEAYGEMEKRVDEVEVSGVREGGVAVDEAMYKEVEGGGVAVEMQTDKEGKTET